MGWNNKTPEDKPACSTPSLDIKTDTCLPLSEICSDGLDTDKQYALSNQGGTTVAVEIVPTDLTEVNDAIAANAAAIAALEVLNPVVDTEVIAGSSDILVTYLDGSTETLDLPEFSASTDADGLITFDLNGAPFGPFESGPHTDDTDTFNDWFPNPDGTFTVTTSDGKTIIVDQGPHTPDTDTFASQVVNPDGTVTVTYADGSTATYATGPHTVDTDTTYEFTVAADGSITITGSDGSTFTGPPNTVDTDTDTFATLSGQTITFADNSTLTVHADDDVESVSDGGSNLVDNTDPRNPVIRALTKWDGSTFDATSDGVVTDNVVADVRAANGLIQVEKCDGTVTTLCPRHQTAQINGGLFTFDGTTAEGTRQVLGTVTFDLPCTQRVSLDGFYQMAASVNIANAAIATRLLAVFNGGGPQIVVGLDQTIIDVWNDDHDRSFSAERGQLLAAGTHTVELIFDLVSNNLQAGDTIVVNQNRLLISYVETV